MIDTSLPSRPLEEDEDEHVFVSEEFEQVAFERLDVVTVDEGDNDEEDTFRRTSSCLNHLESASDSSFWRRSLSCNILTREPTLLGLSSSFPD